MKINKFNSIKTKVFALLGLAVLALMLSGWIIMRQVSRIQEQALFARLKEKSIVNAKLIDKKLKREIYALFIISRSPILKEKDITVSLTYLNNLQKEKKKEGSNIISLALCDLEGYMREAAAPDIITHRTDKKWFKAIKEGATLAFTAPGFSKTFPDIIRIGIAKPVFKDGQLYRILYARLGLNQLIPLMDELKFGEKGRTFILDKYGICIAHPDTDLLLVDGTAQSALIPAEIAAHGRQAVEKVSGQIEYTFRGVCSILNFKPSPLADWIVVTVADRDELLAPLKVLNRQIAKITAVIGLILLFFGWHLSDKITRPLKK